jgi:hypothetical protein
MRNSEAYLGSLVWLAVATLLPVAALEPVKVGTDRETGAYAASLCNAAVAAGECGDARL